jgi:hypothetical protein
LRDGEGEGSDEARSGGWDTRDWAASADYPIGPLLWQETSSKLSRHSLRRWGQTKKVKRVQELLTGQAIYRSLKGH